MDELSVNVKFLLLAESGHFSIKQKKKLDIYFVAFSVSVSFSVFSSVFPTSLPSYAGMY